MRSKTESMVRASVRGNLDERAAHGDRLKQVIAELRQMSENSAAKLGPSYKWKREDCYER
ncbi:MAG: hypothetical protein JO216_18305 [Hyphomicrobiales bacterium]|nr:hypothetical protein [Hyphomicrobiales bacterium]